MRLPALSQRVQVRRDRGLHSISASFTYDGGHFSAVPFSDIIKSLISPGSNNDGVHINEFVHGMANG